MTFDIKWVDVWRDPGSRPDPAFPRGRLIDWSKGAERYCGIPLPYPAAGVGFFDIYCHTCSKRFFLPAAGKADDPVALRVACGEWKAIELGHAVGR